MNRDITLADDYTGAATVVLHVIGMRPLNPPYLSIRTISGDRMIATVTNANALRGLAHRILRALGDE